MNNYQYPPGGGLRVTAVVLLGVTVIWFVLFMLHPTACLSVIRRGEHFIEETFPDPQDQ